ncbi:MAG: DUF1772 domain-containing protein [Pseudorhodoplanes sp.]|nr:DUF1772 domain-containing protein [Pseudorhodoplanes sp.]
MLAGLLALVVASVFAGAAIYINVVEQPARLTLENKALLRQWKPAYKRGFVMQASLAVLGFVLGMFAWWQTDNFAFVLGAIMLIANWPYTLIGIMPTNAMLMNTETMSADADSRALIVRWGRLHAVRTALGFAAVALFVIALARG